MSGITAVLSAFTQPAAGGGGGTSYRYYRIIQANGGGSYALGISEVELFTATTAPAFLTSNGTDLTTSSTTAESSYSDTGSRAINTIDNSSATVWYNGPSTDCWISFDLGTAQAVRSANIEVNYAPSSQNIVLQGSNDNSAWTDLASISSPTNTVYSLAW